MASFNISTFDLLQISFAIHSFLLLRAVFGKLLDGLLPLLAGWAYKFRDLYRLHESAPSLLPRIFSEQVSLLMLTILALVALSHTSVSLIPFAHQPHPTPDFLIRVVLCVCTARYMLMASWLLLGRELTVTRTRSELKVTFSSATSESGSRVWDFFYFVICGGTSVISLGYRQNLLLAMTLPFLELTSILKGYRKLTDSIHALKDHLCDISDTTRVSVSNRPKMRGVNLVSFITCLFCRVVLPVLFLSLALQRETPLVMDRLPLTWFLLNSAFLSIFHLVLIYNEIVKIASRGMNSNFFIGSKRVFWGITLFGNLERCCRKNEVRKTDEGNSQPQVGNDHTFCLHDHPESLTNDIHQNIALKKQNVNKYHTDKRGDLTYGLLRPCDNRNVSFCMSGVENRKGDESSGGSHSDNTFATDKINISRKKDVNKTWLLYRLLANSLASPTPSSISPSSYSLQSDATGSESCGHNISELHAQPWMFPALLEAVANSKLQSPTPLQVQQHSRTGLDTTLDKGESFQFNSSESLVFEDPEQLVDSCDSWLSCERKDVNESSQLNVCREENMKSLTMSSSRKKESDKPCTPQVEELSSLSKSSVNVDHTFSKGTIMSSNQPRHKGKHQSSSDCVHLLGCSTESIHVQGSYKEYRDA